MRKQIIFLTALSALMLAGTAGAQMPPGKWWRRPEIADKLALTADQQNRLDAIFRGAANELIDQRAEVEKVNVALRGELDQPQLNKANVQRLAQRLGDARGKLFEREVLMLVDMRGVLNDEQWTRLRAELDRPHNENRGQQMDRMPMGRPGMKRPPVRQ